METKVLEIRDEGTHIPALAIKMLADNEVSEYYIHYRTGYSRDGSGVVLMMLSNQKASSDPYEWGGRTMPVAHNYIIEHFDTLSDGDVVDVSFILGETKEPRISERLAHV